MSHVRPSHPTKHPIALLPILAMLVLVPLGCDGLLAVDAGCFGDGSGAGAACSETLQGIPAFPPPPCWNEAGEIQSDEVCAKVHEERRAAEAGEGTTDGEEGSLPAPPELPD